MCDILKHMSTVRRPKTLLACHAGLRSYQEDRYFVAAEFLPENVREPAEDLIRHSVIAVFDGHGESASAADHCAKRMPELLSRCMFRAYADTYVAF